jgi:hypothetical protein
VEEVTISSDDDPSASASSLESSTSQSAEVVLISTESQSAGARWVGMTDTSVDTQSVEGERLISIKIKSIEELSLEIISTLNVSIEESRGTFIGYRFTK